MSKIVLTYGDTTLREEDVGLLQLPNWLNDNLIAFYLEYLSDQIKDEQLQVIHPSTMFLVAFAQDEQELQELLEPLSLTKRDLVLIPLNNNSNITRAGGSHWSLLVFHRTGGEGGGPYFEHFDSMKNTNETVARQTVKKFAPLLGFPSSSSSASSSSSCPPLIESGLGKEGQQENGYDCGVYLLGFAEQVLRRQPSPLKFTPKDATNKRKEIRNLIFELAKQRNKP